MKNTLFSKLVTVFSCLLSLVCSIAVGKVILSNQLEGLYLAEAVLIFASLIYSLIYLLLGFKKDLASLYKKSIALSTFNALIITIASVNEINPYASVLFCTLSFGLLMVLLCAENLGSTKSYIICIIILVLRAAGFVSNLLVVGDITNDSVVLIGAQLSLALMVFVATSAKYVDKNQRGTK